MPSLGTSEAAPASYAVLDLLSDLTGPGVNNSEASVSPSTVPSQTGSNALSLKNSGLGILDGLSGSSGTEGKEGAVFLSPGLE